MTTLQAADFDLLHAKRRKTFDDVSITLPQDIISVVLSFMDTPAEIKRFELTHTKARNLLESYHIVLSQHLPTYVSQIQSWPFSKIVTAIKRDPKVLLQVNCHPAEYNHNSHTLNPIMERLKETPFEIAEALRWANIREADPRLLSQSHRVLKDLIAPEHCETYFSDPRITGNFIETLHPLQRGLALLHILQNLPNHPFFTNIIEQTPPVFDPNLIVPYRVLNFLKTAHHFSFAIFINTASPASLKLISKLSSVGMPLERQDTEFYTFPINRETFDRYYDFTHLTNNALSKIYHNFNHYLEGLFSTSKPFLEILENCKPFLASDLPQSDKEKVCATLAKHVINNYSHEKASNLNDFLKTNHFDRYQSRGNTLELLSCTTRHHLQEGNTKLFQHGHSLIETNAMTEFCPSILTPYAKTLYDQKLSKELLSLYEVMKPNINNREIMPHIPFIIMVTRTYYDSKNYIAAHKTLLGGIRRHPWFNLEAMLPVDWEVYISATANQIRNEQSDSPISDKIHKSVSANYVAAAKLGNVLAAYDYARGLQHDLITQLYNTLAQPLKGTYIPLPIVDFERKSDFFTLNPLILPQKMTIIYPRRWQNLCQWIKEKSPEILTYYRLCLAAGWTDPVAQQAEEFEQFLKAIEPFKPE